ncbi:InlB B-repeat-containing protein [Methanimicrococcus sp. OttesenSCG-928-J09]|nr:InlB B-repeat-containing protein [Methanimicrococcus sp. OttesenSCG-928-J09]
MVTKNMKTLTLFSIALLMILTFAGTALAADNFLVIFMSDEDTVYLNKPVPRYGTVSEPEPPVKEGYKFGGWYTEPACINKFDFDTRIPSKTTLYAKWVPTSGSSGTETGSDADAPPAFKVPGFGMTVGIAAVLGAVLIFGRRKQ